MYEYNAKVLRVIDGDTIEAVVDLGFGVSRKDKFRLAGINAPEMRGEEREAGKAAKEWLVNFLKIHNNEVRVQTIKDKQGKYGRYLAELLTSTGEWSINVALVRAGHAEFTT